MSSVSRNLYTNAAIIAPTRGPTINTHTQIIGSVLPAIAAMIAGPMDLAGFTDVPVKPIPKR